MEFLFSANANNILTNFLFLETSNTGPNHKLKE